MSAGPHAIPTRHLQHRRQRLANPLAHRRRRPPTALEPVLLRQRHLHALQPDGAVLGTSAFETPPLPASTIDIGPSPGGERN